MERGNVVLNNPQRFEGNYEIPKEKLDAAIQHAVDKLERKIKEKYGNKFPKNNYEPSCRSYEIGENNHWVCGLHTGCLLLAYQLSGRQFFLDVAASQIESYAERLEKRIGVNDHDVGFVYSPSCVAYYKMTGDERAKQIALDAAEYHYQHNYSQKGGFILRISVIKDKPEGCRTMMDTLMNIPLFYWAYEMTGEKKYLDAANAQVDTTEKCLIRPDGSSYHHYQFEVGTHKPLHGLTFQGNSDDSTWSRGHSWGVLGFPIAYSYTKREDLPPLHKDLVYFMLNHLPEDYLPYWDYDFTEGDELRDSSAAAIAVCGMLEAAKSLPDSAPEKAIYRNAAAKMLETIIDTCTEDLEEDYDGVMYKVTGAKKMNIGLEGCAPYGDMFYFEALLRYTRPDWKHLW